jgi:hypothetical protein
MEYKKKVYFLAGGIIIALLLLGYYFYNRQFETKYYVNACEVSTDKCEKLLADYYPAHCGDIEIEDSCDNPNFTLNFSSGSKLGFEYCGLPENNKFKCFALSNEEKETGDWVIELINKVKVRK